MKVMLHEVESNKPLNKDSLIIVGDASTGTVVGIVRDGITMCLGDYDLIFRFDPPMFRALRRTTLAQRITDRIKRVFRLAK